MVSLYRSMGKGNLNHTNINSDSNNIKPGSENENNNSQDKMNNKKKNKNRFYYRMRQQKKKNKQNSKTISEKKSNSGSAKSKLVPRSATFEYQIPIIDIPLYPSMNKYSRGLQGKKNRNSTSSSKKLSDNRNETSKRKNREKRRREEEDEITNIMLKMMGFKKLERNAFPDKSLITKKDKKKDAKKKGKSKSSRRGKEKREYKIEMDRDYIEIDREVNNIDDLIEVADLYDEDTYHQYSINLKTLYKLKEPLMELKNVVGMEKVKTQIINQVIYFLQGFGKNNNMLHTVIEGPPGVGKTMLGKILAKVYYYMGIIKKSEKKKKTNGKKANFLSEIFSLTGGKMDPEEKGESEEDKDKIAKDENDDVIFKVVRRSDLIGEYLGHTAVKTQKAIDECNGGVLFIDEAYALGNEDKKDTYSKECIDTLNQNLSENKCNFICIIAGYPDQLDKCFFSYNRGLERRFPFKYTIDKYNAEQLTDIFIKQVNDNGFRIEKDILPSVYEFIQNNSQKFNFFGGDMETLLLNCKICHSKRVFGKHPKHRFSLTLDDIKRGFKVFENNKKKEKEGPPSGMYI